MRVLSAVLHAIALTFCLLWPVGARAWSLFGESNRELSRDQAASILSAENAFSTRVWEYPLSLSVFYCIYLDESEYKRILHNQINKYVSDGYEKASTWDKSHGFTPLPRHKFFSDVEVMKKYDIFASVAIKTWKGEPKWQGLRGQGGCSRIVINPFQTNDNDVFTVQAAPKLKKDVKPYLLSQPGFGGTADDLPLKFNVGEIRFGEVTGISGEGVERVVDFNIVKMPNSFGASNLKLTKEAIPMVARFRKYDDGWRFVGF